MSEQKYKEYNLHYSTKFDVGLLKIDKPIDDGSDNIYFKRRKRRNYPSVIGWGYTDYDYREISDIF